MLLEPEQNWESSNHTQPMLKRVRTPRPDSSRPAVAAEPHHFRLFIAGPSARSSLALASLRSVCDEFFPGRYELEVIDMYQQPDQAAAAGVLAAPTLIRLLPQPSAQLMGALSSRKTILAALGLGPIRSARRNRAKSKLVAS